MMYYKKFTAFGFILALISSFCACKDDDNEKQGSFNKNIPVEISSFEPQEVTPRTQFLIYGKNFGNDPSQICLKLGGIETRVVGCNNECLYCMIPRGSNKGTIELTVGGQTVVASDRFTYIANTQVTTLCGYVDETGRYEVKDGTFEECGMNNPKWLSIDPKNPNHIYMIEEFNSLRLIDMEHRTLTTVATVGSLNISDPRSLSWSVTGDTLYMNNYSENQASISITMLLRDEGFKKGHPVLSNYPFVISATTHPVTGDIYFNQESDASIKRYNIKTGEVETMFTAGGSWIWLYLYFHPSGEYAYLVCPRGGSIFKVQYNKETNELDPPTLFVGQGDFGYGSGHGYNEGTGSSARRGVLWQGVWVKNEKYEQLEDQELYDFYVADGYLWGIHPGDLIWRVTPAAEAIRYAGRGSIALDNNHFGYVDGDLLNEARFNGPQSITYDEKNKIFYIGDWNNHRIRQIIVQ